MKITFPASFIVVLCVGALFTALSGCAQSRKIAYEDRSPDEVWIAMKAVAESPTYDDWFLMENAVSIQEDQRRIEIYRHLRRDAHHPELVRPQRQDREFMMRFELRGGPASPYIYWLNRSRGVPAHAWREADRFFNEVADLLDLPPRVASE